MSDRDRITGTFTWTPPPQQTTITRTSTASTTLEPTYIVPLETLKLTTSIPIAESVLVSETSTRNALTDPVTTTQAPEPVRSTTAIYSEVLRVISTGTPVIPIVTMAISTRTTSKRTSTEPSGSLVSDTTTSLLMTTSSSLIIDTALITSLISTPTLEPGPQIPLGTVPAPTKAPAAGLSTVAIAGVAAGGVGVLALLIGLVYFLRRVQKSKQRNSVMSTSSRMISNPVLPPSGKADTVRTFPENSNGRFSQDSQDTLLHRTASSSSRFGSTVGPSSPVWTNATPQVLVVPSSPGFSPARAYTPMSENHNFLPTQPALEPISLSSPKQLSRRVPSSIYPAYVEGEDEHGDNTSTKPVNPYRYTGNPNPPPGTTYSDIGNPHSIHSTADTYPIPESRNLMVPEAGGRRRRADVVSSWMSNGNYRLFERPMHHDRSSYTSNFGFDISEGHMNRNTGVPASSIPSSLDSIVEVGSGGHASTYGSILDIYGSKILEEIEGRDTPAEREDWEPFENR